MQCPSLEAMMRLHRIGIYTVGDLDAYRNSHPDRSGVSPTRLAVLSDLVGNETALRFLGWICRQA